MRDQDWQTLMKALSIYVQGIHFSKGTTQGEQEAIADHMLGVAKVIEEYRQPQFIVSMTDANIRLRKELEERDLQLNRAREILARFVENTPPCRRVEDAEAFLKGKLG